MAFFFIFIPCHPKFSKFHFLGGAVRCDGHWASWELEAESAQASEALRERFTGKGKPLLATPQSILTKTPRG